MLFVRLNDESCPLFKVELALGCVGHPLTVTNHSNSHRGV